MSGLFFLMLFLLMVPASCSDIILEPPVPSGRYHEVVVILFQAPQMLPSSYLPLMTQMQNATYSYSTTPVWVGIPNFENDLSAKRNVSDVVDRIIQTMIVRGLNSRSPIFLAVHSQSYATLVQEYIVRNFQRLSDLKGLILLGAFLDRSYRSSDHNHPYPLPTFTVGAELDGVCRVSRIMEEFYHLIYTADNISTARKRYPVAVMRGMSHLQFASGEPSDTIKKYDLKPEVNDSEAHQTTGSLLGKFVYLTLSNQSIAGEMLVAVETAGMFFQPLLDAYRLEGSRFYKPPCNSGPPTPLCQVGCPWTEKAVVNMAGLSKVDINDTDTFHPATELFHHPRVFNSCPLPIVGCNITTSSVSENIYYREKTDSGLVPNSACEIRAKMKSRQSIMLASGMNHVDFNTTDAGSRCMTINQLVYLWALNRADQRAQMRFKSLGVPIHFGDDKTSRGLWTYAPLQYKQTQDSSGKDILKVSSIELKTDVNYPIDDLAGVHYCKLLSPAKVMEWIYVDGLRAHDSLSGERAELMTCGL